MTTSKSGYEELYYQGEGINLLGQKEEDVLKLPEHEAGCECASCTTKHKERYLPTPKELRFSPQRGEGDSRCGIDYFHCEADAIVYTGRQNRIFMGPYDGKCAHGRLFVAIEGPSDNRWSVIEVEDAIEMGVHWRWTA